MEFIILTLSVGEIIYINPKTISWFMPHKSGSKICQIGDEDAFVVKETPKEIEFLIQNGRQ